MWTKFFGTNSSRGVSDGGYHVYHVILFCSYGNPSSRPVPHRIGTPLALGEAARISLRPREGSEGSIGILLNRSEFDEVVSRFKHQLNLHPDLLDLIFQWTDGHVGAVVKLLQVISNQASLPSESCVGLSCSCLLLTLFPGPESTTWGTVHSGNFS